jgi:hypothetical protein
MPLGLAADTVIEERIQSIPTVLKAARTILTANRRVKNLPGLHNRPKTHVHQGFPAIRRELWSGAFVPFAASHHDATFGTLHERPPEPN